MDVLAECYRLACEMAEENRRTFVKRWPDHKPELASVVTGRVWHKIDVPRGSGAFMVHGVTGTVLGIKGYGRPHKQVIHGPADKITGAELLPRRYCGAHTPPLVPVSRITDKD